MHRLSKHSKFGAALVIFTTLLLGSSMCRASMDYYLKIEGIKGEGLHYQKIVKYVAGSQIDLGPLKAGTYRISIVTQQGQPFTAISDSGSVSDGSAKGQASESMVRKQGSNNKISVTINVNKDAATGMTSGKRQHQPIQITREMDAASPRLFTLSSGDVNGNGVADVMLSF